MSELIRWQDKDLSEYYNADEVDAVLAEKDTEINELRRKLQDQCGSCPVKMQEADVVADLNGQIAFLRTRLIEQTARYELTETQLRHQKYTRCLTMAKLCAKNVDHLNSEGYIYEKENRVSEVDACIKGTIFYHKWHKRWLQLAEEYK